MSYNTRRAAYPIAPRNLRGRALRASFSYPLRHALSFVLSADNLLDHQLGEPDNETVLPGRTITGGLRAKF